MRQAPLGIAGQVAPDWEVDQWFGLSGGLSQLRLSDIDAPVVYLYCFQSWCPGCHSHGFPHAVLQHGLDGIPIGHDVDPLGGPPSMMQRYRTGGTPWTVIIGPERRVCFDGFQVDEGAAVAIIGQLLN